MSSNTHGEDTKSELCDPLRFEQSDRHFADDALKYIFLTCFFSTILLKQIYKWYREQVVKLWQGPKVG